MTHRNLTDAIGSSAPERPILAGLVLAAMVGLLVLIVWDTRRRMDPPPHTFTPPPRRVEATVVVGEPVVWDEVTGEVIEPPHLALVPDSRRIGDGR